MPLTTHVKSTSVNLATGMVTKEFYDQQEWEALQAALPAQQLENAKSLSVTQVKNDARTIIEDRVPPWKQRSMIARMLELRDKKDTDPLTVAEQAEYDEMKALWGWVKQVRSDSDFIESAVESASTIVEVEAVGSLRDTHAVI